MSSRIVYLIVDVSDTMGVATINELKDEAIQKADVFMEEYLTKLGGSYNISKNILDTGFEIVPSGIEGNHVRPLEDAKDVVRAKKKCFDEYVEELGNKIKDSTVDSYTCWKYDCAKDGFLNPETLVYNISCNDDKVPEGIEMADYFVVAVSVHD